MLPTQIELIFFVFPYEGERLVDVCVTYMYIIFNGYRVRIGCYGISMNTEFWKFYNLCLLDWILHYMFMQKTSIYDGYS